MKKILLVDDDPYIRSAISQKLKEEDYLVIEASNGVEAFEKMLTYFFNLVILDINMPKMNGIETIKALKKVNINIPIIVISGTRSKEIIKKAITEGASTCLKKPFEFSTLIHIVRQIIEENAENTKRYFLDEAKFKAIMENPIKVPLHEFENMEQKDIAKKIIIIGASAGGPKILKYIISNLKDIKDNAVIVIQHIPDSYAKPFIQHLKESATLPLKEASNEEIIKSGIIYVAKAGYHLKIDYLENTPIFKLDDSPPIHSMKPAIDPTMISAAKIFKQNTFGIILSGMGRDGTEGAKAIKDYGGKIITQNEETSLIFGMPGNIVTLNIADKTLPPFEIVKEIERWVKFN